MHHSVALPYRPWHLVDTMKELNLQSMYFAHFLLRIIQWKRRNKGRKGKKEKEKEKEKAEVQISYKINARLVPPCSMQQVNQSEIILLRFEP